MQQALDALEKIGMGGDPRWVDDIAPALRARLAQPEPREIKIEFKEWIHPNMGLVPVDPKTPLILKAVIREEV